MSAAIAGPEEPGREATGADAAAAIAGLEEPRRGATGAAQEGGGGLRSGSRMDLPLHGKCAVFYTKRPDASDVTGTRRHVILRRP
jgi:hypothetical protein